MSPEKQDFLPGFGPENSIIHAAALLLIKIDNNIPYFLVAKRLNRRGYTLPGGCVKPGETPRDGATRELLEETGIHLFWTEYLISAHPRQEGILICDNKKNYLTHLFFTFFDGATDEKEPINVEPEKHSNWQWVPLSELPDKIMVGDLHPVLLQEFVLSQIEECLTLFYPSSE
ncbi:NUDIX hydrolase [Patescibacteria group bacterium]|nr:NUDIX hydrolase [Patescibacteria group bacterium]MBU0776661.1 NUDIX hydrolase [Patescibacteria group bacterium]MBU0846019.1 NUDIX hydrolase [Patescibacteria group bacterium]MBU0922481.1 NUDIX hydrolase [Patescibacteria group bacterium]MBU1066786.1 NUDIX hydrolase [Patescibacteria group bacterium]